MMLYYKEKALGGMISPRLFLLIMCLCFQTNFNTALCQNNSNHNFMKLDTIVVFKQIINSKDNLDNFSMSIVDSIMVFAYFESATPKNMTHWYTMNLNTKQIEHDSIEILQEQTPEYRPSGLKSVAFNKNYIAFLTTNRIWVIEKRQELKLILNEATNPTGNYRCSQIKISKDNILYLINDYNFSSNTDDKINLRCINLEHLKNTTLHKIPISHIAFSLFGPTNWVDYYDGYFLVSDNISYCIKIYDKDIKLVDSLTRPKLDWKKIPEELPVKLNKKYKSKHDPSAIFNTLTPYIQDSSHFIWYTKFIDRNTILVKYTFPGQLGKDMSTTFDIWKLGKDNKWFLLDSNLKDYFDHYEKATIDSFTKSNFLTCLNVQSYFSGGGKLVVVAKASDINPINMNRRKYYDLNSKYFIEKDGIYNFYIYDFLK